jgi:hypothetical protein
MQLKALYTGGTPITLARPYRGHRRICSITYGKRVSAGCCSTRHGDGAGARNNPGLRVVAKDALAARLIMRVLRVFIETQPTA